MFSARQDLKFLNIIYICVFQVGAEATQEGVKDFSPPPPKVL